MNEEEIKQKLEKDFAVANPYMGIVEATASDLSKVQKNINKIRQKASKQKNVNVDNVIDSYLTNVVGKKFKLDKETIDNLKTSLPLKQQFGTGRALLQPITLGTADEIEALIKSIGGDKTYEQNLAQLNLAQRMYEKESPEGATAADVTGTAITFPLLARGMGAGFQKLLPKQSGTTSQLLGLTTSGALVSGAEGGARALPSERLKQAKDFAKVGGALSLGAGSAGRLLQKTPLPDFIGRQVGKVTGKNTLSRQADIETLRALQSEGKLDFNDLLDRLQKNQSINKPVSLADVAGDETKTLLAQTAKYPMSIGPAQKFLDIREGGQSERLLKDFRQQIGAEEDAFDLSERVLNKVENVAKPIYRKIMQNNTTPIIDRQLNSIIDRPVFRNIYEKFRTEKLEVSERGTTLPSFKDIFPSEDVGITLEGVDYFKKALDKEITDLNRSGANNTRLGDLKNLRNQLVKRIDEVGPEEYKQARKIYAERYEAEEALEKSMKGLLNKNISAKQYKSFYDNLKSSGEKEAFKVGMFDKIRQEIDTASENVKGGTNIIKKLYQKKQIRDKYEGILGPDKYKQLIERLDVEKKMKEVDTTITSGSPTQPRQVLDRFLESPKSIDAVTNIQNKVVDYLIKSKEVKMPEKAKYITENLIELDPIKQEVIVNRLKDLDRQLFDEVAKKLGIITIGSQTTTRGLLD